MAVMKGRRDAAEAQIRTKDEEQFEEISRSVSNERVSERPTFLLCATIHVKQIKVCASRKGCKVDVFPCHFLCNEC